MSRMSKVAGAASAGMVGDTSVTKSTRKVAGGYVETTSEYSEKSGYTSSERIVQSPQAQPGGNSVRPGDLRKAIKDTLC